MTDSDRSVPRSRPLERWPRMREVPEAETRRPSLKTLPKLIWNTIALMFHEPAAIIMGSAFFLLMLWGEHGRLDLLRPLLPGWEGLGSDPGARARIIEWIPWDQEWISFFVGAFLLVLVPVLLIKWVLHQDLKDYGLGLPPKGRRKLAWLSAAVLFLVSLPAFYFSIHNAEMQAVYPLYRDFDGIRQFLLYELGYLLFFVTIDFIFRGYLLFGLYQLKDRPGSPGVAGIPGPLLFGYYAIFVSMLAYTAWHLGKPQPELWGTLFWGLLAGTIALESRSVVPIILVHWILNIFMDFGIWQEWCGWPFCG